MSDLKAQATSSTVPAIKKLFRLQWEEVQQKHVLLYPEGMVQLNQSAGEILKRCDGVKSVQEITADLEAAFNHKGLEPDVLSFLEIAHGQGWVEYR
jgi:pyrroloquinoline quinone biosynthesis protein D